MDDTHFSDARQTMVDCQTEMTKVTDEAIIDAFATVPREAFVSATSAPRLCGRGSAVARWTP